MGQTALMGERRSIRWPVSVKAVVGPPGHVVLLHNERDEWELPGGRLEVADPSPQQCVEREVAEELGLTVEAEPWPLHTWLYQPVPDRVVLVVAYRCSLVGEWPTALGHSDEHDDVGLFAVDALADLALPEGYRSAIERA